MNAVRRLACVLVAMAMLSCARSTPAPTHPQPVTRALAAKPHRLAVVFWPQLSGCSSCDQMISAVIAEWQTAPDAELAVVTVVPERERPDDPWLPGTIVRMTPDDYSSHARGAPLPRVEIWSGTGQLLLRRSVPNTGSQVELLTEEMLAARSFTTPGAATARAQ